MNPRYGDFDPYHMAASAIDEAVRNCVAVGADPEPDRHPRQLLLGRHRAARDARLAGPRGARPATTLAVALGTPFISGKDSLNNEFRYVDADGADADDRHSAVAADQRHGPDRRRRAVRDDGPQSSPATCCTSSARRRTNWAARTSPWCNDLDGGQVPQVDPARGQATFAALHRAIDAGLVRACHDLSEGGLAVAAAEMAFAGGFGAEIDLRTCRANVAFDGRRTWTRSCCSPNRTPASCAKCRRRHSRTFEQLLAGVPHAADRRSRLTEPLLTVSCTANDRRADLAP